ncbi:MAG: hypothetical protein ACFCA4_06040 [Cyanophyceae cyanobacterium]
MQWLPWCFSKTLLKRVSLTLLLVLQLDQLVKNYKRIAIATTIFQWQFDDDGQFFGAVRSLHEEQTAKTYPLLKAMSASAPKYS